MNIKLKALYNTYWNLYVENFINKVDAAFPYLIYVPEQYERSPKKVMFCGQETQSWNSEEYKMQCLSFLRAVRPLTSYPILQHISLKNV